MNTKEDIPLPIPEGDDENESALASFDLCHLSTENLHNTRLICDRCKRPSPKACICSALPNSPVVFSKCCVLVLVHPLELKRKNRSLPLIELCVVDTYPPHMNIDSITPEFSLCTQVGRKFHITMDPVIQKLLHRQNLDTLLIFPSPDAILLQEALDVVHKRRNNQTDEVHRIILIFVDATWKQAKEMEQACTAHHIWPDHVIRVRLQPQDFMGRPDSFEKTFTNSNAVDFEGNLRYQPKRFHIRTPPSESHFSTAESIAMVTSRIEGNAGLYDTFMKPLDLMVQKWMDNVQL